MAGQDEQAARRSLREWIASTTRDAINDRRAEGIDARCRNRIGPGGAASGDEAVKRGRRAAPGALKTRGLTPRDPLPRPIFTIVTEPSGAS
jgi:hypothetical protein